MAVDLMNNLGSATITAGGTDAPAAGTVETWTAANQTNVPAASSTANPPTQFRAVDPAHPTEIMLVTNVNGAAWTVTRGVEGTTPVNHGANFTVIAVFTTAGLLNWLQANATAFDAAGAAATERARATAAEALLAPKASPALTGAPTAPTPAALDNSTKVATTSYADAAVGVETARATAAEAARWQTRGTWTGPGAVYAVNDVVDGPTGFTGGLYRCITAHTSGATFTGAGVNWETVRDPNGTFVSTGIQPSGDTTGVADLLILQNALNSAPPNTTVQVGSGLFYLSNTLAVPTGVKIRGAGRGKTVFRTLPVFAGVVIGGTTLYAGIGSVGTTGIEISGITVDTFTNSTNANAISLLPTSVTPGDWTGTPCSDAVVEKNEVLGWPGHAYCIFAVMSVRTKILHNWVNGNSLTSGIPSEGIEIAGGTDVLVEGNSIRNAGTDGINVPSIIANQVRQGIRIVNNYIDGADYGIGIVNGNGIDSNANIVGMLVEGNQIWNSRVRGISVTYATGVTINDLKIIDNQVHTPTGEGIGVVGATGATITGIEIRGNTIDAATASLDSDGAIFINTAANTRIVGNTITNSAGNAIFATALTDCSISGNRITSAQKSAIWVTSSTRVRIGENEIHGYNLAASTYRGIQVDTTTDAFVHGTSVDKGSGTEQQDVYITSGCDRGTIRNTRYMGQSGVSPVVRNDGTNPSFGTATAAAAASFTITNTQVRSGTRVHVQQTGGTPQAFTYSATGSSTITITGAAAWAGTETFAYELLA